jgi:hypothetical protein
MGESIYTIHSRTYYDFADVLCGSDTWSDVLRKQRLRVFWIRVLRRIFVLKREETTVG